MWVLKAISRFNDGACSKNNWEGFFSKILNLQQKIKTLQKWSGGKGRREELIDELRMGLGLPPEKDKEERAGTDYNWAGKLSLFLGKVHYLRDKWNWSNLIYSNKFYESAY